jgi:hypothetical protein
MLAKLLLYYSFSRISHMQYRSRQPFQLHVVKSAKSEEHVSPAARRTDLALQIDLHKISTRDTRCYRLAASIRCCCFMLGRWFRRLDLSGTSGFKLGAE